MAALIWLAAAGTGWSQNVSPPPAPPPSGPETLPPREESPGVFNEMGKMLEKSLSILPPLKSPSETLDDLNTRAKEAAKDAGESLSRLARPASVATGRVKCPPSPNGASDCKVAADALCQAKGFKEGKSLTTDSVEACSPKVLIPGRARKPDDCHTDNYVSRALCQ
ncbi:MAG TPA: hypothetical protein VKT76_05260 [Bradyrhizobium sp.]|nr:hypothetical protein [Bradyrhizobium sp.]